MISGAETRGAADRVAMMWLSIACAGVALGACSGEGAPASVPTDVGEDAASREPDAAPDLRAPRPPAPVTVDAAPAIAADAAAPSTTPALDAEAPDATADTSADAAPAFPPAPVVSYPTGPGGPARVDDIPPGDACKDVKLASGALVVDGWDPNLFLPGGVKTIRCLLGGASYLHELARLHHCGVIRQPPPSPETLTKVLQAYAQMTGHPELEHVQVIGSGYSKAYGEIMGVAAKAPERFLALFGGGIHTGSPKTDGRLEVPWLSFNGNEDNGSIPGAFIAAGSNHPWWANNVALARARGGLFGHGVRWGRHHEQGDSRHLMFVFYHQVIPRRAPAYGAEITKLAPTKIDQSSGWLVSTDDWNTAFPTIAPYAEWKGDRTKASWVPDAVVAHALRAFTAKDSPVALLEPACGGDVCTPRSAGTKSKVLFHVEVTGEAPQKVELWDGDKLITPIAGPPYRVQVTDLPFGNHAFYALATYASGKKAVSKLRSVMVERPDPECPPP